MAKKKSAKLKRKGVNSFGVVYIDHIEPAIPVSDRKPIVIGMTIDEGLKLHLALLQALSHLNRLDRRAASSRAKGVTLSLFPDQKRMMVEQGAVKDNSAPR